MSNAGDPPDDGPDGSGNVLPFIGTSHGPELRLDADASLRFDALLTGADKAILEQLRLEVVGGLERSLIGASGVRAAGKTATALKQLRASHSASRFYVVEVIRECEWAGLLPGKSLLIAPAAKLRPLGLCIVAFNDDRPPGLRWFAAGREWHGNRLWVLGGKGEVEPAEAILALHPVVGSIETPLIFDDDIDWPVISAELLTMPESPWSGINPTWRP